MPKKSQAEAQNPSTGETLDTIYFGDASSEMNHGFQNKNAEVPAPDAPTGDLPDVYISSTTASSGPAPEMSLREHGEWSVGSKREWIQYELNKATTLDQVQIAWSVPRNNYHFTVKTTVEGEDWQKVYSDRAGAGKETYEFDPVEAKKVRIVAGGAQRWWRPGTFRMKQVWLGDLPHPEAYEPAAAYQRGMDRACRRLMSNKSKDAFLSFTLDTDPEKQNNFTVKFWGSDRRMVDLRLSDGDGNYIDGAAPAWKPLGGYGASGMAHFWEFGGTSAAGGFPGRFIYATYPLPHAFTEGKDEVTLKLTAAGETPYPSQGIYAAYTHTGKYFAPPADEPQGEPFEWEPTRPNQLTHEERLKKLKDRAKKLIEQVYEGRPKPGEQGGARRLQSLTDAYHAEWSDHYQDDEIVHIVKEALDAAVRRQAKKGVAGHM
ncbi:MAG: discoidin domain-containing protein, partial [Planctomycetota bacterium]